MWSTFPHQDRLHSDGVEERCISVECAGRRYILAGASRMHIKLVVRVSTDFHFGTGIMCVYVHVSVWVGRWEVR